MDQMGKWIITLGLLLILVGVLITIFGKVLPLGRLPGDFVFRGTNTTFYFPLMTSIVISILLTLFFRLFMR